MRRLKCIVCLTGFLVIPAMVAMSAPFNLDWYTVIGGYQASTGGQYKVTSSAVESTGGAASGGNYTVSGGYAMPGAILSSGNPRMIVFSIGDSCVLTWPVTETSFTLERSADLSQAIWQPVSLTPVRVGDDYVVTIPVTDGGGFFRLAAPGN